MAKDKEIEKRFGDDEPLECFQCLQILDGCDMYIIGAEKPYLLCSDCYTVWEAERAFKLMELQKWKDLVH